MTDTAHSQTKSVRKVLLADPPPPPPPGAELIRTAAKQSGTGPITQFAQQVRLRYGEGKLMFNDYYDFRLFDPSFSMADRKSFVGKNANRTLNRRLNNKDKAQFELGLLTRKALTEAYLRSKGMATTTTVATLGYNGEISYIPNLGDAAAVADFLRTRAAYPLFVKPDGGSKSVGSARIDSFDPKTENLTIGNGAVIGVEEFAREVVTDYSAGFLFQENIRQHPDVARVAGKSVGTVRVVTVHDGTGADVLYALWKLPAKTAMSDNFWQAGSLIAALDASTGAVKSAIQGSGTSRTNVDTHPETGVAFKGLSLPLWAEVRELAKKAHDTLPALGVVGFDIAISEDGPLIVECNSNPFHMLYQIAEGRGIMSPDMQARFNRVANRWTGSPATA